MPNWKGRNAEDIPTCLFEERCVILLKFDEVAVIQTFKQTLCGNWVTAAAALLSMWGLNRGFFFVVCVFFTWMFSPVCCSSEEDGVGRGRQRHNRHGREGGAAGTGSLERRIEELERVSPSYWVYFIKINLFFKREEFEEAMMKDSQLILKKFWQSVRHWEGIEKCFCCRYKTADSVERSCCIFSSFQQHVKQRWVSRTGSCWESIRHVSIHQCWQPFCWTILFLGWKYYQPWKIFLFKK